MLCSQALPSSSASLRSIAQPLNLAFQRLTTANMTSTPPFSSHLFPHQAATPDDTLATRSAKLSALKSTLREHAIEAQRLLGDVVPPQARMHDRGAVVPALVISPKSEWGVSKTLELIRQWNLYEKFAISVKSGGHAYFNGASCPDIMLDLSLMNQRRIVDHTMFLQPGCVLAQTIDILAKHGKAVPHGDCFGVGAGGHFLTAGWDLILTRRHGLGCQSVVGGRVVLWDGEILDVSQEAHPHLLYAMRGGAVAEAGVVTEIRLQLIDQPTRATWRYTPITWEELQVCTMRQTFQKAGSLPRDISVSFRLHFDPAQLEPVCSFNVVSLLTACETVSYLHSHLGPNVAHLVDDLTQWHEKSLIDLRMLPASQRVAQDPGMLAEASGRGLHENPEVFWNNLACSREMAPSFFRSISFWVKSDCDAMLLELWAKFSAAKGCGFRARMYALVIMGGGAMTERQDACAMPLGQALSRFELHWDDPEEKDACENFTCQISKIMKTYEDRTPGRQYRGDIWQADQAYSANDPLKATLGVYDRRGLSNLSDRHLLANSTVN